MPRVPSDHPQSLAPNLAYASNAAPPRVQRPVAVSLLASLGIVIGSLMFFCNVLVMATEARMASNPSYSPVKDAPPLDPVVMKIYAANAAIGMVFGATLIGACLAALSLRPMARQVMMIWSVTFILWGVGRTVGEINYAGPATVAWVAHNRPQDPTFASGQLENAIVPKAIGVMVLYCVLPTLFVFFWNRAEVKAAFGSRSFPVPSPGMPGEG